jgi:SNF2 family DNA or RNA helicase
MLCAGTIDEEIYSLIERKRGVVNQAVDGVAYTESDAVSDLIMSRLFKEIND